MQAMLYHRYGPPDVLRLEETEIPIPAAGQVLLRMHAASVNPYDWHFLRGTPKLMRLMTGLGKPRTPRLGADAAGVVESIGPGVTRLQPGDAVFGVAKGSFGQYACAKESELALKPASIPYEQAAAVPIAAITALQALRDCAHLQPGQSVLINGAAGGVGTFAVQIATANGARVTAVCSAPNVQLVRSLGADLVYDYATQDFTAGAQRYDVIFDLVGNHPLAAFRRVLHPTGTLVSCGGGGPDKRTLDLLFPMVETWAAAPFTRQKLTSVFAKINTADLALLADLIQTGKITPVLDRTYTLAQVPDAIRHLETCHARGKVVIAIA